MFTGLIEEIGSVRKAVRKSGGVLFSIASPRVAKGLRVNDSVAVEGVCLTVIRRDKSSFETQAVEETLVKTTLGTLQKGEVVNLERPLLPTSRLGGHFVLGHVDCVGEVVNVERRKSSWMFRFSVPRRFAHYLIPVGSIAINGVSLTIASLTTRFFAVSIIPHTMSNTTFRFLRKGSRVNIEFDVLGKYVERIRAVKRR